MKTRIEPIDSCLRHARGMIDEALSNPPSAFRKHLELMREYVSNALVQGEMVMVKSREATPIDEDE